jgi:hypothetical protein
MLVPGVRLLIPHRTEMYPNESDVQRQPSSGSRMARRTRLPRMGTPTGIVALDVNNGTELQRDVAAARFARA